LSPSSRAMRDEEPDCLCFPCFEKRGIPPDQVDGIHPSQIAELSEHTDVSRREAERIAEVITGSPPKMGGGAGYAHCANCVRTKRQDKIEVLIRPPRIQIWCASCNRQVAMFTLAEFPRD
jgi:hypothetical protein